MTDAIAARRILAFGDSNTYGWMPVAIGPPSRRYGEDSRWPGVLRRTLGAGYEVIEDGLSGRTTDVADPTMPQITGAGLDGLAALPGAIATHLPLDLVVIMLGTNDLKAMFARSALRIALGAGRLADTVRSMAGGIATDYPAPRALLVAPPPLGALTAFAADFAGGEAKSRLLGGLYAQVANMAGAEFLDAGAVIATDGADGVHFSAEMQRALGSAIAEKVRGVTENAAGGGPGDHPHDDGYRAMAEPIDLRVLTRSQ